MKLKDPLCSEAWTDPEALSGAKVVGKLDFSTDIEIVYAEMLADVVPELRFGDEYRMDILSAGPVAVAVLPAALIFTIVR